MAAAWPPSDEKLDAWFAKEVTPKGKGKGEYPHDENLFYYALDLCINAAGYREYGVRYHSDPGKLTPYMDEEVKGALRYMINEMEKQPMESRSLGHHDRREYLNYKQYCDVTGALLGQNREDPEVVELIFLFVLAAGKHRPNVGMWTAASSKQQVIWRRL
eukprot:TRINITY_DN21904_c0_g2_i1.p1 TRINITY_DN21904_c0_g2~~TRINITY_DN21904_c0_g2_i1.p1  ORF type:complete len:173 (+),score=22.12 TRINITY_DN21904_c0_g2_i1:42-521(+)